MASSGFRRLRVVAAAGALGVSAVPGVAAQAHASTKTLPFAYPTYNPTFTSTEGRVIGLANDAQVPVSFGAADGFGVTNFGFGYRKAPTQSVSFWDNSVFGGLLSEVNNQVFEAPQGKVDVTGNQVTFTNTFSPALDVTGATTILPGGFVRYEMKFHNNGTAPFKVDFRIGTEYGWNSPVIVDGTGDGDHKIETKDGGFVVSDGGPFDGSHPAPVLQIFGNCNDPTKCKVPTFISKPGSGSFPDVFKTAYKFTVRPGHEKNALFFINVFPSPDAAKAELPNFRTLAAMSNASFLDGIPSATKFVNWKGKVP